MAVLMLDLLKLLLIKLPYKFVVHSNEIAHEKSGYLGLDPVIHIIKEEFIFIQKTCQLQDQSLNLRYWRMSMLQEIIIAII